MNKNVENERKTDPENGNDNGANIRLSAPWGGDQNIAFGCIRQESTSDFHNNFVKERTRVHEIYILEQAKNKRIGLVLAFLLILLAALLILFAPEGRETLSYWIGAALVIFSAGALGFGRVWGKAANISFGADQDRRNL
ncbi:MAG: hypothetical protein D3915_14860 [Candidatus Electrothrix sp. AU1_5]|nr:hypothetical protein [Candidatus Electrothrix gigas]